MMCSKMLNYINLDLNCWFLLSPNLVISKLCCVNILCSVPLPFLPAISGWKQWWCHISYDACVRRTTTSVEFWLVLWTPIRSDTPKVDHVSMICFRLYCCGCHRFIYFSKECLAYKLIPWYNKNCVLLQISFFFLSIRH